MLVTVTNGFCNFFFFFKGRLNIDFIYGHDYFHFYTEYKTNYYGVDDDTHWFSVLQMAQCILGSTAVSYRFLLFDYTRSLVTFKLF